MPKPLECFDNEETKISESFEKIDWPKKARYLDKATKNLVSLNEIVSFLVARFGKHVQQDLEWIGALTITLRKFALGLNAEIRIDEETYLDIGKLSKLKALDLGCGHIGYKQNTQYYEPWLVRALSPFMDIKGIDCVANEPEVVKGNFLDSDFLDWVDPATVDVIYSNMAVDRAPCPRLHQIELARQNVAKQTTRVLKPNGILFFDNDVFRDIGINRQIISLAA